MEKKSNGIVKIKPTASNKLPIFRREFMLALGISAIVLILIVLLFGGREPEQNLFLEVDGMDCDDMLIAYDNCIKGTAPLGIPQREHERSCKNHYVDEIVDCYRESVLRDQLALMNESGVE